MKNSTKIWISVLIIIIAGVLLYFGVTAQVPQPAQSTEQANATMDSATSGDMSGNGDTNSSAQGGTVIANAVFECPSGQSIQASFLNNPSSVNLTLSDGRTMSLPQVVSADGARYANADGSFVFWNVGNGASIQENGQTTYDSCTTAPAAQ